MHRGIRQLLASRQELHQQVEVGALMETVRSSKEDRESLHLCS